MPKIVVTPVPDIQDKYTRRVSVEMTEAEWEAYKGFAAVAAPSFAGEPRLADRAGAAAQRASHGSKFYWYLDLDWDKLF